MWIRVIYSLYFHFIKMIATILFSSAIVIATLSFFGFFRKTAELIGYYIGKGWGKTILFLSFVKIHKEILTQIPPDKKYVFAANHQSSFDIYLLYAFAPLKFVWVAKKALFNVPFLGWAMALMGHIGVERENSKNAAITLRKAVQKIKNGTSIAIFPEGTRSGDGKLLPFKKGAFVLGRLGGLDMIPVLIKNSCQVAKKGKFILNPFEEITIKIYPAIATKDKQAEEKLRALFEKELEN